MQDAIASSNHLGQGWAFPLRLTVQGGIQATRAQVNVRESIHIILGTRLGERVYRPDFGSRLSELVFEPMNSSTLTLIVVYVEEALRKWEPRIGLEGVEARPNPAQGRIDVTLAYRLKEQPDRHSLVYPFYLAASAEA